MLSFAETIVAPVTGPGPAAVAVVRISGEDAFAIAGRVFLPWPEPVRPRYALYGRFVTGDDGLATAFERDRSYTGEATVEFSVHGSPASVRGLMEACCSAGARMARPGEFTERAFLNGRMDLSQAEAVRDTVAAQTDRQMRHANLLRAGALRAEIGAVREPVLGVFSQIEAAADFADEVGPLDREACRETLSGSIARLQKLAEGARSGRIIRQGLTIAIVGRRNAGKSSLLNCLVGADRAIVTPIPGTTRDTVEETVELAGLPCRLIDTAGWGATEDPVERIGQERARQAAASADLAIHLWDATAGWTSEDEAIAAQCERPTLRLPNKTDLVPGVEGVSCLTGAGLQKIEDWIGATAPEEGIPWVDDRQGAELTQAAEALASAEAALGTDVPDDLAAVGLQAALQAMGRVDGETADADLLERIFRDFCIGK